MLSDAELRVLGLPAHAAIDRIEERWRFLVLAFHPDKFEPGTKWHKLAEERLRELTALRDSIARARKQDAMPFQQVQPVTQCAATQCAANEGPTHTTSTPTAANQTPRRDYGFRLRLDLSGDTFTVVKTTRTKKPATSDYILW